MQRNGWRWPGMLVAVSLVTALLAAGCGDGRLLVPPLELSAPGPVPDPPQTQVQLPSQPLWGEPGRVLLGEPGDALSCTYQPVTIDGVELTPLQIPQGMIFVRRDGDQVVLHGLLTSRGGYSRPAQPYTFYRLPLEVGSTWSVDFPGMIGEAMTYRVVAIESVATPAGELSAARIEVMRQDERAETEWWVPGYGLVRSEGKYRTWIASREEQRDTSSVRVIGHLPTGEEALLWDDGQSYWVTTMDGQQELFRVSDSYWRSWYSWAPAGEQDLLVNTHFPGSWGIYRYSALRFDPEAGRFVELEWRPGQRTANAVAGHGRWAQGGLFDLEDFLGYPKRRTTYVFDGRAMQADPERSYEVRAESAEALARRLFDAPPVGQADFVATFQDQALGQQAWETLEALQWKRVGFSKVVPVEGEPMSFVVADGEKRLKLRLIKVETDFRVVEFQVLSR